MPTKVKQLPEIHLHKDWMLSLEKAKVKYTAWGSAGPDILVSESGAILEIKREEKSTMVRQAYAEIFDRTNAQFAPRNASLVGVITPEKTRIWLNRDGAYGSLTEPDIIFEASEREQVLALIRAKDPRVKLVLDDYLDGVLKLVYSAGCPEPAMALLAVLNLHKHPVVSTNRGVIFAPGTLEERELEVAAETRDFIMKEIVSKYSVRDPAAVKKHIRHKWSQYQPDGKKAALGKYYTPEHLVKAVQAQLGPTLLKYPDAYVADLAAGCGAFLAAFEDYRIVGRDIDAQAVDVLSEMGFSNVAVANSLKNVGRHQLELACADKLIIVGNPPYNDASSFNKRYSTDKKDALTVEIDADIKSKDLGVSFMRAFGKLGPDAICVLHPLSYLTKKTNFARLKEFASEYTLSSAFVFSSAEFGENIGAKSKVAFPVVAALYVPGCMEYGDIRDFKFPLYASDAGEFGPTGLHLSLNSVKTIDGVIRKYPPTQGMPKVSDIGLYNYNIRDTNSLLTSGAFMAKLDNNAVPIQFEELWKYSYLNCLKRYFGHSFVFGNVSPIYREVDFSYEWFRDACVFDAIMNNQGLSPLSRLNPDSFVVRRFLVNDARRRAKTFDMPGVPNFYAAFVEFWETGAVRKNTLSDWWKSYFVELRASQLI